MRTRTPVVSGSFYSSSPGSLRAEIEGCFKHRLGPGRVPKVVEKGPRWVMALVSPHAGFAYSGPVAAHGYVALAEDGAPDACVLLGPNHTGLGSGVSVMPEGLWRTPLGDVEVESELAARVADRCGIVDLDDAAHRREHSLEVQLPFLQYLYGSVKIVPICFLMQDLATARDVGAGVAEAVAGRDVVIVASTDLTHYEPQDEARAKDRRVIDAILSLDEASLANTVESYGVSMCGPGPVAAAIVAVKALGSCRGELLAYATSGDVTRDYRSVVGYASIALKRA